MAEYIIGNNDIVSNNGTISVAWEHTLQSLDTLVCPANAVLTSLNLRNLRTDGASATVNLGIYDITSGVNSAPLLHQDTITVDLTAAGVYSVTGLSVDFSAHSGKTLAIAIAKPSSNTLVASRTASVAPRSSSTAATLADPFVQNDTNGSRLYGVWAVLDDTPTSETATTGNIPLVIQAGYTLVDLVDPVTTNASLLFGVTGDTPVTGDHLEYDVTSVLDSGVSLSVAASGVWTVTEAVDGDWTTDITVSRRVVQADGTIGTEAVLTLEAPTGTVTSLATSENEKLIEHFRSVTGLSTYSLNELAIAYYKQVGSTGSPQFNEALKAAQDGVPFKGLGPTDWRN